jgi:hypothetical protein
MYESIAKTLSESAALALLEPSLRRAQDRLHRLNILMAFFQRGVGTPLSDAEGEEYGGEV